MPAPKSNKTRKINFHRKSELIRQYREDLKIARRRGMSNLSVKSLNTRRKQNDNQQTAKNNANHEASKRVKIAQSVIKLRYLNKQLKTSLDLYNDKIEEGHVSDKVLDGVSVLIDSIKVRVDDMKGSLTGFHSNNDDHPYEFVDDFSDYIDDDIIHGFKKASYTSIEKRVKISNVILKILEDSIKDVDDFFSTQIKASNNTNNNNTNNNNNDNNNHNHKDNDKLVEALENMMGLIHIKNVY
jgi:hypothetical protein